MKKLSIILLLTTLLGSCGKNSEKVFAYNQTQCSDKWGYGATDAETIAKLKTYLASKQITVLSAILTSPPGDLVVCQACTCPSGRSFKVVVEADDTDKLKLEGFY